MALSGNKGEWSEIYVFLYLLGSGKLEVADDNLNVVPGEFYKILEIIRKEAQSTNNYLREEDRVKILITNNETGDIDTLSFPIVTFVENAKKLLDRLKSMNETSHFEIEQFLTQLKIHSLKDVGHKRDITIKIEDFHCAMTQTLGFSIKSFLGAKSTLFNPGAGTNFIYEVRFPQDVQIDVDAFNAETYTMSPRIHKRLSKLVNEYKADFVFSGIQSDCLNQNLRTVDGDLPFLLSDLLLIRYLHNTTAITRCTEILTKKNPLHFDVVAHGAVYEYKVKRFLQDCALGMVPETPWRGVYDATGGQIIVKEDGQVVCYHIYEQNRFLDYLFKSTKLEYASSSEDPNNPGHERVAKNKKEIVKPYKYGWLYRENGKYYLKLNLQIRFK